MNEFVFNYNLVLFYECMKKELRMNEFVKAKNLSLQKLIMSLLLERSGN